MNHRWLVFLLITGCTAARIVSSPEHGRAFVEIPKLPSGYPAVRVTSVRLTHALHTQIPTEVQALSLRPGTYHSLVTCSRNIRDVVLGPHDLTHRYTFTVVAGGHYILDCSITNDGSSSFSLEPPPNNSFKPTPHRGVGRVPTLR
jgi:hypothetical protein